MAWSFFADLQYAIDAIFRMEEKMGAIAKAVEGWSTKLDKIEAEFDRGQEPDAEDRAALAAVQERLQRLDDKNPDVSATPTPVDVSPEPQDSTPLQSEPEPSGGPDSPATQ